MLFRKTLILLSALWILSGCDSNRVLPDENVIGLRLDSISVTSDSENIQKVNMFDETTRRIHSFDIDNMKLVNSFAVTNPSAKHYVLASNDSSFFIDLSSSSLSIYNYNGQTQKDILRFIGTPISSAYNTTTRHLVIYDELNSVHLLKVNPNGILESQWTGGPIVNDNSSILAGDITESGNLILSLTNGELAVVNIDQSIQDQQWSFSLDSSLPHQDIKWISAVKNNTILYQNKDALVLYDYVTKTILDQKNYPDKYITAAYGKTSDPHVIYKKHLLNRFLIAYADGVEIKSKEVQNHQGAEAFYQSRLDLNKNHWSFISTEGRFLEFNQSDKSEDGFLDSFSISKENRRAVSYRFSDLLVIANTELSDDTKLKRTQNHVFTLFPSKLGYAEKVNVFSSEVEVLKNFNIRYIKK